MKDSMKRLITLTTISAVAGSIYATTSLAIATPKQPAANQVAALQAASVNAPNAADANAKDAARLLPTKHMQRRHHRRVRLVRLQRRQPMVRLGLRHNKRLTADDARVITTAALLETGHKHLKVGPISTQKVRPHLNRYNIAILNQHNKIVKHIAMNSATGRAHPIAHRA